MLRYLFLLCLTFFLNIPVFSAGKCAYTTPSGEEYKVTPEFLVSLAIQSQTEALRQAYRMQNSKDVFKSTQQKFDTYFKCRTDLGLGPDPIAHYQKAITHYELREWNEALSELKIAIDANPKFYEPYELRISIFSTLRKKKELQLAVESALTRFPDNAVLFNRLASIYWEQKQYPKAIPYYLSILNLLQMGKADPRFRILIQERIGMFYLQRGEFQKAIEHFQDLTGQKNSNPELNFYIAMTYEYLGNFAKCKEYMGKYFNSTPFVSKEAKLFLAEVYFVEARSEALTQFESLIDEDIKKEPVFSSLYNVLKNNYEEAKPELLGLLEKNSARISAQIGYLEVLKKNGTPAELMKEYTKAILLSRNLKRADLAKRLGNEYAEYLKSKNQIAELFQVFDQIAYACEDLGEMDEALENLEKAEKLNLDNDLKVLINFHRALILKSPRVSKISESNKILEEILKKDNSNSNAYFLLGLNYLQSDKKQESIKYFTKALEFEPDNANILFYRASAYEKASQDKEAIDDLKRAVDKDKTHSPSFNYLGYYYAEKNMELDEALRLARVAVELDPINSAYRDSLGWTLFKLGKKEEAILELGLSVRLMLEDKQSDPVVYEHLGDVFYSMNDINNAQDYWKKSMEIQKEETEKDKLKEKIKKAFIQKPKEKSAKKENL